MPDDAQADIAGAGAEVVGGYLLGDRIDAGAPFETYAAHKEGSDETVTVKILVDSAFSERVVARFSSIKDTVLKLGHINIGRCLAFGRDDGRSRHYWVMEDLDGQTLHERTKERGALPENELIGIGRHMSGVLDVLYGNGLIHRGIEPSCIVLCSSGYAKLADLGIADLCASDEATDSIRFAPPEQASGSSALDVRSDIYSLGASLYFMATGKAPFEDLGVSSVAAEMVDGQIPWPSDVNRRISQRLSRVIAKMMAKDPAERYKTPTELTLDFGIVAESQEPVIAANTPSKTMLAPAKKPPVPEPQRPPTTSMNRPATASGQSPVASERQAIAEPAAVDEEALPPASSHVNLIAAVGGGLIAAVIGIVLIISSRSGTAPLPEKPSDPQKSEPVSELASPVPPEPESVDSAHQETDRKADREAAASALLAVALTYVAENPEDYEGCLLRLQAVQVETKGTAAETDAVVRMHDIEARWNECAIDAVEELRVRAEALAHAGDIDGALSALAEFDESLSKRVPERIAAVSTSIAAIGAERVAGVLDEVKASIEGGRLDDAPRSLASLDGIRYERGVADVAPRKAALLAEIGKLEEDAVSEAQREARKALSALMREFDAKLDAGDAKGALALMDSAAGRPELAPVTGHLSCASAVAKALFGRQAMIIAAARKTTGEKIAVATSKGPRRGVLESVDDAGMNIATRVIINGEVRGETKYAIPWAELLPEEQDRLAGAWQPAGDEGHLAMAVVALQQGDIDAADKHLRAAGDAPVVGHYITKLLALKAGAAETAAAEAWSDIERRSSAGRLSPSDGKALAALIASFEAEHGGTAFATSKAAKIAEAKAVAEAASSGAASAKKVRVILTPCDDTYLDASAPRINWGRSPSFKTTLGTPILMRFDCTRIPKIATVAKATMSLFVLEGTPNDSTGESITAHSILPRNVGWREGGQVGKPAAFGDSTFAFRAIAGRRNTRWAGGTFSKPGIDFANAEMGTAPLPLAAGKRCEIELDVAAVQTWIADPSANHGLALMTGSGYHPRFSSKEDGVSSRHPALVLELLLGAGDVPAVEAAKPADTDTAAAPTDLQALVKDGQWGPAPWAATATVAKRDHKGKPALTIEVPAGEERDKGAVGCTCEVDLSDKGIVYVAATNLEKEDLLVAIAIVGSKGYYETRPVVLRSGRPGRVAAHLEGKDFKCEASGWEFGAQLAGHEAVRQILIIIYNGNKRASLLVTGMAAN